MSDRRDFGLPKPRATADRGLIDIGSASHDPDREGVGSSPLNDNASSRVFIPVEPTPHNGVRYLVRLAGCYVPAGRLQRIRGIRQAIGIGALLVDRLAPASAVVEIDQTSPFWSFPDGNISWHLRIIRGPGQDDGSQLNVTPGRMSDYASGTESALLLAQDSTVMSPAAGIPAGEPVGNLGTFRDLRYPWYSQSAAADMDYEVSGPSIVVLYASIKQTDPATRQNMNAILPPGFPQNVLSREDQFVNAMQANGLDAIYRHVSGSIVMEQELTHHKLGMTASQVDPAP